MKNNILVILSLLLFIPGIRDVSAQAGIEITVFDIESNQTVEGAVVFIENSSIGFELSGISDDQGKVRFRGLSTSGSYEVYTEASENFHEARASDIRLRNNFTRSVALILYPLSSFELDEITVTGSTSFASINTINAEISSTLQPEEIEALPIEGRDITRALYRLPNVTQATWLLSRGPNS